jgi:hypothetical protein
VRINNTAQAEGTDYTLNEETGVIVFASAPADGAVVTVDYQWTYLTDSYYTNALARHNNNVKRAAADACETIGRDQVLLLKVVRLLDSTLDGGAMGREMRLSAQQLRRQADDEEAREGDDALEIVEMVTNQFGYRERMRSQFLRGGW